jgi:hypothetical protein
MEEISKLPGRERDFRRSERSRSVEILTAGAPSGYFAATFLAGAEIA